jgi:hypothetical protein
MKASNSCKIQVLILPFTKLICNEPVFLLFIHFSISFINVFGIFVPVILAFTPFKTQSPQASPVRRNRAYSHEYRYLKAFICFLVFHFLRFRDS